MCDLALNIPLGMATPTFLQLCCQNGILEKAFNVTVCFRFCTWLGKLGSNILVKEQIFKWPLIIGSV